MIAYSHKLQAFFELIFENLSILECLDILKIEYFQLILQCLYKTINMTIATRGQGITGDTIDIQVIIIDLKFPKNS